MNNRFSKDEVAFMKQAIEQAHLALEREDVPVGAVLVHEPTGKILAMGRNTREAEGHALGHAEINAIDQACRVTGNWRLSDCVLYVTLEPCPMCAGAILAARIPRVVCGAKDAVAGAMGSVWALQNHPVGTSHTQIVFGCLEDESKALLRGFFQKKRS